MSHPECQPLTAFTSDLKALSPLKLEGLSEAPDSLKTRLLELGLVKGTTLQVSRNGGQFVVQIRGDRLLLRAAEAQYLMVSTSLNG